MKYIKKFNNNLDCQNYINNNAIDPALFKINDNVKYINKAGNYIQDGLIFQLDGKYKGFYNNVMTDLISGKHINIANNGNSPRFKYEYDKDSFKLLDIYNSFGYIDFDKNFSVSKDYTVEVCILFKRGGRNIVFSNGYADCPLFATNDHKLCFIQRENQYNFDISTNIKYTFSLNLDHGYCNTVELSQTNPDYWNETNYNRIVFFNGTNGGMLNNTGTNTLYAIRIYNRRLTPEEQLHNQNIDIKRFNITI